MLIKHFFENFSNKRIFLQMLPYISTALYDPDSYWITPRSSALLDKLLVSQIFKKSFSFYRTQISLQVFFYKQPLAIFLRQVTQFHALTIQPAFNIHFNIFLLCLVPPSILFRLGFQNHNTSPHPHTCHMFHPSHYSWFYYPDTDHDASRWVIFSSPPQVLVNNILERVL